jgi:hypothetical protein
VGKKQCGGHNLPPLVGIGLNELPNSRWAKPHPGHTLGASLLISSKRIVNEDKLRDKKIGKYIIGSTPYI